MQPRHIALHALRLAVLIPPEHSLPQQRQLTLEEDFTALIWHGIGELILPDDPLSNRLDPWR